MPRKAPKPPSLDDVLDDALGKIVSSGWDDEPAPATLANAGPQPGDSDLDRRLDAAPLPTYPPLPVKEKAYAVAAEAEPTQKAGTPETDENEPGGVLDIGLLTDLATGRKGAVEAAEAAGVTHAQLQSSLATALHGIDPGEIAKALGIQAAEQQLKSGALYGAVLFDLVADMKAGRMKPDHKIELAKLLAKVGRIEPKEDKGVAAGGGFVLNIQMGQATPPVVTIEAD